QEEDAVASALLSDRPAPVGRGGELIERRVGRAAAVHVDEDLVRGLALEGGERLVQRVEPRRRDDPRLVGRISRRLLEGRGCREEEEDGDRERGERAHVPNARPRRRDEPPRGP